LIDFTRKCLKPRFIDFPSDNEDEPDWYEIEFDGKEDFLSYYVPLLSHFTTFVNVAAERFPYEILKFIKFQLDFIMKTDQTSSNSPGKFISLLFSLSLSFI
jgi:hypothetical protein